MNKEYKPEDTVFWDIDDDGKLCFEEGSKKKQIDATKELYRTDILDDLNEFCNNENEIINSLSKLHLETPSYNSIRSYSEKEYILPKPDKPILEQKSIKHWIIPFLNHVRKKNNNQINIYYEQSLTRWNKNKEQFDLEEKKRKKRVNIDIVSGDIDAIELELETVFNEIDTIIDFDFYITVIDVNTVKFEFNLPDIDQIPDKQYKVNEEKLKIDVKKISESGKRGLLISHIYSAIFRLIGETFSSVTILQKVIILISLPKEKGDKETQYIFSSIVNLDDWLKISLLDLHNIDTEGTIDSFNTIKNISTTNIIKTIKPHQI